MKIYVRRLKMYISKELIENLHERGKLSDWQYSRYTGKSMEQIRYENMKKNATKQQKIVIEYRERQKAKLEEEQQKKEEKEQKEKEDKYIQEQTEKEIDKVVKELLKGFGQT